MENKNDLNLGEASFSALVFSFATAALLYLGLEKHPESGAVEKDLNLARLNIDWLLVLKDKTKSNLSREEQSYLDSVITDLQVKYVQVKNS